MHKKKALVLVSGGQDSTTCLYLAKNNYDVLAIGFDYGQRHIKEIECAHAITKKANIPYDILSVPIIGSLSNNALTSNISVDKYSNDSRIPNTLVEGRNMFFLSFAAVYAKARNIKDIFIGVSQTDYSGYPDCRNEFIQSLQKTLNLCMEYDYNIHTPLMYLDKAETWAMAEKLDILDIIKNDTLTCYNGIIGSGCKECPSCVLRQRGYEQYVSVKKSHK